MGEMADMLMLQGLDDMLINPDIDEFDPRSYTGDSKTCRCCGRPNLHWELRQDKWRLCDGRGVHKCKVHPLPLC